MPILAQKTCFLKIHGVSFIKLFLNRVNFQSRRYVENKTICFCKIHHNGGAMKSSLKWLTVILGVSAFGLASASEKISWKKLDEGLSLAKSQNKKLLIDFYGPT